MTGYEGTKFVGRPVSISPTFYVQLLHSKVPKAPNDTADLTVFFAHLGSVSVKAVHSMLMK